MKKNDLGTVLHFNEQAYNHVTDAWEKVLLPTLYQIVDLYGKLGIGTFTQEKLTDIIHNGISNIYEKHRAAVEEDLKFFKVPAIQESMRRDVEKNLAPISQAIIKLMDAFQRTAAGSTFSYPAEWQDITYSGVDFIIDKSAIKKRYSLIIETESQSEYWSRLQALQIAWNDFHHYITEKGYNARQYGLFREKGNWNGIVFENEDKTLAIIPESIKAF